jgi:hypothetical protein
LSSGVLYHASAAYTFAIDPLYEFRGWFEIALDFALALCIYAGVLVMGKSDAADTEPSESQAKKRETIVLIVAIVLLMIIGVGSLLFFRIMWLDAVLAGLALFLHNTLSPVVKGLVHRLHPPHQGGQS